MGDEFVITSEIMENPRFLSVSMLAGRIYMAMILRADNEGRALADPITWKSKAACWGAAESGLEDIAAALDELNDCRLAPQYESGGKRYIFLPGRFEHNPGRTYWKRSKCPLPPVSLLEEFPEYTSELARLTTKSELRNSLRNGENWRYPQLAHLLPTPCPVDSGIGRASPVGVGVGVGVEKRGERAREAEGEGTTSPTTTDSSKPSPPFSAKKTPTREQRDRITEMAAERGLTATKAAADCGLKEITKSDVTRVMDYLRAIPKQTAEDKAVQARNASVRFLVAELESVHQRDGPEAAADWVKRCVDAEDHDTRVKGRVKARLKELDDEKQEARA